LINIWISSHLHCPGLLSSTGSLISVKDSVTQCGDCRAKESTLSVCGFPRANILSQQHIWLQTLPWTNSLDDLLNWQTKLVCFVLNRVSYSISSESFGIIIARVLAQPFALGQSAIMGQRDRFQESRSKGFGITCITTSQSPMKARNPAVASVLVPPNKFIYKAKIPLLDRLQATAIMKYC